MTAYPDGNPKTGQGALKAPLHLVPPSATHFLALAFADGARKYGPYNWRDKGVSASVYVAAARRHFDAWWDGEDLSPDAQVHHLAHVMACAAIVLDALTCETLNDDRPPPGAAPRLQQEYAARIRAQQQVAHNIAAAALRDRVIGNDDEDDAKGEPLTPNTRTGD